ncbi:MAG: MFS transporter, partial [Halobacteriales archaeon]|nr:MFS transporter [Halobacteriales archaeon]
MLASPTAPGLGRNARLFALLVLINGFVGTMAGVERTLVPILGEREFGLASKAAVLGFIATFGIVKAVANLAAGAWSDHIGRRKLLIAGWVVGLPAPLLLMLAPAPHWELVLLANALLGVNQGLCWSTAVIMKVDLAGEQRRGLALG